MPTNKKETAGDMMEKEDLIHFFLNLLQYPFTVWQAACTFTWFDEVSAFSLSSLAAKGGPWYPSRVGNNEVEDEDEGGVIQPSIFS